MSVVYTISLTQFLFFLTLNPEGHWNKMLFQMEIVFKMVAYRFPPKIDLLIIQASKN